MRRSPDGGKTFKRSSDSGYRYEVAISEKLPNRSTTVPTYRLETYSTGRLIVLDLDTKAVPAKHAADQAGYIARVAQEICEVVAECGGRTLVDLSPSGGRHVYLLWADWMPFTELRALTRAFARRWHPPSGPSLGWSL